MVVARPKMLGFRLDTDDLLWVEERAASQDLTVSQYLRSLVRIARATEERLCPCVLIDNKSAYLLERELKKQGYNLNQGIKALNTIALYIDRNQDADFLRDQFTRAHVAFGQIHDVHSSLLLSFKEVKGKLCLGGRL